MVDLLLFFLSFFHARPLPSIFLHHAASSLMLPASSASAHPQLTCEPCYCVYTHRHSRRLGWLMFFPPSNFKSLKHPVLIFESRRITKALWVVYRAVKFRRRRAELLQCYIHLAVYSEALVDFGLNEASCTNRESRKYTTSGMNSNSRSIYLYLYEQSLNESWTDLLSPLSHPRRTVTLIGGKGKSQEGKSSRFFAKHDIVSDRLLDVNNQVLGTLYAWRVVKTSELRQSGDKRALRDSCIW